MGSGRNGLLDARRYARTRMADERLQRLESGRAYRFAHHSTLTDVIPGSSAGVYTIWDDAGELIYVGVAGRNPQGKGLASRLRSHASRRRNGDQFCVYGSRRVHGAVVAVRGSRPV